jgi:hypothetical protein
MHRIYEPPPEGEGEADRGPTVSVELDKFVLLVFEHIGGPEGGFEQVTFERLQPVLFDTPLLLQFLSARIGEQRYIHHQPPPATTTTSTGTAFCQRGGASPSFVRSPPSPQRSVAANPTLAIHPSCFVGGSHSRALDIHHWHPRLQTSKPPHTSAKKGGAVHDM